MDPREFQSGGDPDEETMARKRARRVSFAETTAVHVFDRDEDIETPPDFRPGGGEDSDARPLVGFPLEHSDSDDSRGSVREEDDEEEEEQESFLRDMNSYSPGSVADSVTSNDDENFFGPVSTSFIKTGRYSDSGMSDDNNHDITLDSTAFSLHFRNIAPPDDRTANSMGSVRTPTEISMPADSGNFMVPTGHKKPVAHSKLSNGKISGSASDSNNMSLIMENPNRYDYGKMSPRLEALLAEVNRSIEPDSLSTDSRVVTSDHHRVEDTDATTVGKEQIHTDGITEHCDNANNYSVSAHQPDVSLGGAGDHIGDKSYVSNASAGQHSHSFQTQENQFYLQGAISSFSKKLAMQDVSLAGTEVISSENHEIFSPKDTNSKINAVQESDNVNHNSFGDKTDGANNHSISSLLSSPMKTAEGLQQILEYESGMHTPKCALQPFQSPVHGSVSSIRAKRQQLFSDPVNGSTKEQPPSSIKMELERHSERILAIKSSISKFKVPAKLKLIPHLSFAMEDNAQSQLDGYSERTHDNSGRSQFGSPAASGKENANSASVKIKDQEFNGELSGLETEILNDSRGLKLAQSTPLFQSPNLGINIKKGANSQKLIEGPSISNSYGSLQKQTIVELRENGVSRDSLSKAIYSAEVPGPNLSSIEKADRTVKSSSVLKEKTFHLTHSSVNHDIVRNSAAAMDIVENGLSSHNSQMEVEISRNVCVGTHDKDFETRNFSPRIREKLSKEHLVASSHNFTSEDSCDVAATKNFFVKLLGSVTAENPSNKIDSYSSPPSKRINNPNQDTVIHGGGNPDYHHQKFLASPEPFSSKDVDKIGKKRRITEVLLMDKGLTSEVSKTQKSPTILLEVVSSICGLPLRNAVDIDNGHNFGVQGPVKHWADILSKVSGATKQSFSPSVYNLEAKQLDFLEDVLGELHMTRKYEGLSEKIPSLKNPDPLADLHQERIAEARRLQEMLAYEQAKLQLKHVKLDQLHKTSRQCQSGIQECYKLKSILTQICPQGTRAFQTREATIYTVSLDSESNNQEEQHKCTSMQQELEMLDKKVNQLMKCFAALCKIKGNVNCNGVIKVVQEHLDKREHCRAIHQNLQLWELSKIEKKQEQCDIFLNYRNLLSERVVLKTRPTSSICMYNSLNKTSIEKSFPSMNAFTAFEFVFKARNDRRLAGSKSLQQETLGTSLLLGTLLDVLEEVQIALFQIPFLVSSTFHSQYSGQLELQLCFLSNKSGRKLSLSLSMTDLNCAMYPSEPAQLDIKILERQTTLPISSFDQVTSAVRSLQSGRTLVLRVCQRVSEVVQVSS